MVVLSVQLIPAEESVPALALGSAGPCGDGV